MLRQFTVGERTYGLIEGSRGYIVTENDFCHVAKGLEDSVELNTVRGLEHEAYKKFTLDDLRPLATLVSSYQQWVHYWGIKGRIHQNYRLLLASMKDIGTDTSNMPEWGEEPKLESVGSGAEPKSESVCL